MAFGTALALAALAGGRRRGRPHIELAAASLEALAVPASSRGARAVGVNGTTEAAAGTVMIVLPTLLTSRHGAHPPLRGIYGAPL